MVTALSPTLLTTLMSALHLIRSSTISLLATLHAYISGVFPYMSVNSLKNDYIKLKTLGFEELDVFIN